MDRPLPKITVDDRPFWDAAARHEFVLQHCPNCNHWFEPAVERCWNCHSASLGWKPASGRGVVHTFNVYHRAYHPWFADKLPYNTTIVELEEGVLLLSQITGCAVDDIRIGMPVQVVYEDIEPGITLPMFRPTA